MTPHTKKPTKKFAFPVPIPPCSVVEVKDVPRSPWAKKIGRVFRIGYYSQTDGLDCIWLIDETGNIAKPFITITSIGSSKFAQFPKSAAYTVADARPLLV